MLSLIFVISSLEGHVSLLERRTSHTVKWHKSRSTEAMYVFITLMTEQVLLLELHTALEMRK